MKLLFIVATIIIFCSPTFAAEPTTGFCDTTPETYVSTNGQVQVRYNVKEITVQGIDGKSSHTAYSYDYKNISKLDQAELGKQLPPTAVNELKSKALKIAVEKVVGYNNNDKAAYEAKFNSEDLTEP